MSILEELNVIWRKWDMKKKFPLGSGVCCCYANIFICQKHDEIQLIKQVETWQKLTFYVFTHVVTHVFFSNFQFFSMLPSQGNNLCWKNNIVKYFHCISLTSPKMFLALHFGLRKNFFSWFSCKATNCSNHYLQFLKTGFLINVV